MSDENKGAETTNTKEKPKGKNFKEDIDKHYDRYRNVFILFILISNRKKFWMRMRRRRKKN